MKEAADQKEAHNLEIQRRKQKKLDPLILAHQVEFTLRGLKMEKQNKAKQKIIHPKRRQEKSI